jgi:hypothetical protein
MAGVTEAIARTEERRYPRGTVVVVDDGCPFEARVVAVIGVVAVVAPRSQDAARETYRAVPMPCCRPVGEQPPSRGERPGTR